MIRKLFMLFFLAIIAKSSFAQPKTISNTKLIKKISDSKIVIQENAIVPPRQIFYIHDLEGTLAGTVNPGEKVSFFVNKEGWEALKKILKGEPPKQDCYKVACPDSAPEGSTCWDCKPAKQ